MKLRYSPTSPYVRKVTVAAIEIGLDDRIERIATNVWDPASDIIRDNPLGKVPTLITDDGLVLVESAIIAEYLDSLPHTGPKLFPPDGPARWQALHLRGLADGICDAGVARLIEMRRPEQERSVAWLERQHGKLQRGLDALEREAASFGNTCTIGEISVGCMLGFLDFRFPREDWRSRRSALNTWFLEFATRRSMLATAPKEP